MVLSEMENMLVCKKLAWRLELMMLISEMVNLSVYKT